MPSYKDEKQNSWYSSFYYTDWQGKRLKKMKRGFATKKEAQEFERNFLQTQSGNLDMNFEDFVKTIYRVDMKNKIREHTWESKNFIIDYKILLFLNPEK